MEGTCNKCGKCCQAIIIPVPQDQILNSKAVGGDYGFALNNWKPITEEEAYAINPHLKTWDVHNRGTYNRDGVSFWTCTQYDHETKLCKAHEKRPSVCSGYPFYGREYNLPENFPFYDNKCGFNLPENFETNKIEK